MAKKLIDIKKEIDSSGRHFFDYVHHLIDDHMMKKIDELSESTEVFLFSGIIRNYFLKIYFKRDVDIVLGQDADVLGTFKDYTIKKNSFGGFKIFFPSDQLDLWFIKDTWAFQHSQKTLNFNLEKQIPKTAFFNFSSIIYSLNRKEFYYSDHFVKFLKTRSLDYVYEHNPNYPLCVVNTFYYSDSYHLSISERLLRFIFDLHKKNDYDYSDTQIKHFGKIIYSNADINERLNTAMHAKLQVV